MELGEGKIVEGESVELNDKQRRARRLRNIAIALCLFALVAVFYTATIVKFGPRLMDRPIISLDTK
jgi:hypothetical protein